jgi:hypothetical protein
MVLLNAVIEGIFLTILSIDVGLALFFAMQLARAAKQNRPPKHSPVLKEVPSLSVCIPARNERHAMTQCLERVLASDYEKLEIVVFDDSSDDETSVLIRSFAHAGVRFVPGSKLPEGWLGKNHALDILAQEASGAYVVFMDVDAFIEPTTLTNLMSYMQSTHKTMVSVIPQRQDAWRTSVLFGPLRYFWQATLASPATSGAFWAIKRDTLLALGGLEPHKNEVQAEAHIATLVGTQYQWLFDDGRLGVSYEKKWRPAVGCYTQWHADGGRCQLSLGLQCSTCRHSLCLPMRPEAGRLGVSYPPLCSLGLHLFMLFTRTWYGAVTGGWAYCCGRLLYCRSLAYSYGV